MKIHLSTENWQDVFLLEAIFPSFYCNIIHSDFRHRANLLYGNMRFFLRFASNGAIYFWLKTSKSIRMSNGSMRWWHFQAEKTIEFRDSKGNKLFLQNNHFPLPKYILFEFFHLNLGQQCVQNFIINGGLGEFTNAIRGSSLSMMFSLILFPTRKMLIQFIRMYLLNVIKISSNFKMWGPHLPLFTIYEENTSHQNLFLSSLFYEIRSLEIAFDFEDSLHVKNFTEQWTKEVSTSSLVPCPNPYGELAISIHIDEIFDWLVRKRPMEDGSAISRVLQVDAECLSYNCADQMNYINILIENLKKVNL